MFDIEAVDHSGLRRTGCTAYPNTTTKEIYNGAVTAVLFLIFGADLIAKGLPPLT